MRLPLIPAVVAVFMLAGCSPEPAAVPVSTTSTAPPVTSTTIADPVCTGGETVEDGIFQLVDRTLVDAATVTSLGFNGTAECERLVIGFATPSRAPATSTGQTRVEVLRPAGIVRIHLDPSVTATTTSDIVVDGDLLDRVYVVRDLDLSLFIDLHLAAPVLVHGAIIDDPARLLIEVVRGGSDIGAAPAAGNLVLMPPTEPVIYPLTLTGYGRTFEANVIARLWVGESIEAEEFTTAVDYLETWGSFQLTIPSGPSGTVDLFVGEDDARDGTERGVRIPVTVGES